MTKRNFSDDDTTNFQDNGEEFFQVWLDLVGYDGITNYVHMVAVGHLRYYLRVWQNLNQFQNQGWESYNQFVAAFWHHRTTRGEVNL